MTVGKRAWVLTYAAGLLVLLSLTTFLRGWITTRRGAGSRADTVVVIDGREYGVPTFEASLGRPAEFYSAPQARVEIERFASTILLDREVERRSRELGMELSRSEVLTMLVKEAGGTPQVTAAQVEQFYRDHLGDFVHPPRVRLAYFRVQANGDLKDPAAQAQSLYLRAQMNLRSRDFDSLLQRPGTGIPAGKIGTVSCTVNDLTDLPSVVVERACALREGQLAAPLETQAGWFVIRKLGSENSDNVTLDAAKARIRNRLTLESEAHAREQALQTLKAHASVAIPPGVIERLVMQPPVAPLQSNGPPGVPGRWEEL